MLPDDLFLQRTCIGGGLLHIGVGTVGFDQVSRILLAQFESDHAAVTRRRAHWTM